MSRAYYNEIDPFAADWLENLIAAGHIAPGDVDRRSIADVQPADVIEYEQVHLFAGIGGWSYALRLAGWTDARPVWTGSCPCTPFSTAGLARGEDDHRHLWPEFRRLVEECSPPAVFGEQVANTDGRVWLDRVRAELVVLGYAVGSADLCAAGVGAPHIRQRLYFVGERGVPERRCADCGGFTTALLDVCDCCGGAELHEIAESRCIDCGEWTVQLDQVAVSECCWCGSTRLAHSASVRREGLGWSREAGAPEPSAACDPRPLGAWSDYELVRCTDVPRRRIEPGALAVAHGIPGRVGRLRGYGNAIVPQVAAEFVAAYMDTLPA